MENVIRYVRESEDEQRARRGEDPLTDREFVDKLLAMKYTAAADLVLGRTLYYERPRTLADVFDELDEQREDEPA